MSTVEMPRARPPYSFSTGPMGGVAVRRDFSGHGQVVVDRDNRQRRNQRRRQCDTRGGAVLRHSALGGMDVQVDVLELVGRDAVFLGVDWRRSRQAGRSPSRHHRGCGDLDFAGAVRDDGDDQQATSAPPTLPHARPLGNAHGVLCGDKRRLTFSGPSSSDHRTSADLPHTSPAAIFCARLPPGAA